MNSCRKPLTDKLQKTHAVAVCLDAARSELKCSGFETTLPRS